VAVPSPEIDAPGRGCPLKSVTGGSGDFFPNIDMQPLEISKSASGSVHLSCIETSLSHRFCGGHIKPIRIADYLVSVPACTADVNYGDSAPK
jgi:hypothetical protein